MDFISNQEPQIVEMLRTIGVDSVEALFAAIPPHLRMKAPQEDDGLSESEGMALMESIAQKNTFPTFTSYLGGGAYHHHVPALVGAIASKSEFLTSYTPYQAEASQGMLQVIFEFQSAIAALTGMDVANASLYDGATACAEAALMALRLQKERTNIVISEALHPHYQKVIEQYLNTHPIEIRRIPYTDSFQLDMDVAYSLIDQQTAAVIVSYPNFFGMIDSVAEIAAYAKTQGALTVVSANPLVYGLYASAAEIGADIAIGEAQPFGLSLNYGGPYLGYMACKQELVRQLPGRLVGETTDKEGRRGFVLTLQAREQHIRREKATSNICTNQALAALGALVAMLWYGKEGIKKLALTNYQRTAYLKQGLSGIKGIRIPKNEAHFNEFPVSFGKAACDVQKHFRNQKIEPGLDLGAYNPVLSEYLLVAVTELKTKEDLDYYIAVAKGLT